MVSLADACSKEFFRRLVLEAKGYRWAWFYIKVDMSGEFGDSQISNDPNLSLKKF